MLFEGMKMTIIISVVSLLIAFALGLITLFFRISRIPPLVAVAKVYLWIIRGTPLLVQTFFIYFGLPQAMAAIGADFRLDAFAAGTIALSLNAGAYMSEIFRSGILAVGRGQEEAARSLGLSKSRTMATVILPQALRICAPSLVNQFIITLKDTSIISVIGFADIVYQAKIYIGRTMESFATYTVVGAFYLVAISVLTSVSSHIERRMNSAHKS